MVGCIWICQDGFTSPLPLKRATDQRKGRLSTEFTHMSWNHPSLSPWKPWCGDSAPVFHLVDCDTFGTDPQGHFPIWSLLLWENTVNQDSIFWELLNNLEGGKGHLRTHELTGSKSWPSIPSVEKVHCWQTRWRSIQIDSFTCSGTSILLIWWNSSFLLFFNLNKLLFVGCLKEHLGYILINEGHTRIKKDGEQCFLWFRLSWDIPNCVNHLVPSFHVLISKAEAEPRTIFMGNACHSSLSFHLAMPL